MKLLRTFRGIDKREFEVPDTDLEAFRSEVPDAVEVMEFRGPDQRAFAVPESDLDQFRSEVPDAAPVKRARTRDGRVVDGPDLEQAAAEEFDTLSRDLNSERKKWLVSRGNQKRRRAKLETDLDAHLRAFAPELGIPEQWARPDDPAAALPEGAPRMPPGLDMRARQQWMEDREYERMTAPRARLAADGRTVLDAATGEPAADAAGGVAQAAPNRRIKGVQWQDEAGVWRDGTGRALSPYDLDESDERARESALGFKLWMRGEEPGGLPVVPGVDPEEQRAQRARLVDAGRAQRDAHLADTLQEETARNIARLKYGRGIGAGEQFTRVVRNAGDYIPFSPVPLAKALVVNDIMARDRAWAAWDEGGRQGPEPPRITPLEEARANQYLSDKQLQEELGRSMTAGTVEGVAHLVPYMAEMAMGGGLVGAVQKGVGKALVSRAAGKRAAEAVGKWASKSLARRAAAWGGRTAGALAVDATVRTALNPAGFAADYVERRMAPGAVGESSEPGQLFDRTYFPGERQGRVEAFKNTLGDRWVEYFSEGVGDRLTLGLGKALPGTSRAGRYVRRLGTRPVAKYLRKAGFAGGPLEFLEERVGGGMREALGVDLTAEQKAAGLGERLSRGLVPGEEEGLIEAAVLMVPMLGAGALNTVMERRQLGRLREFRDAERAERGAMDAALAAAGIEAGAFAARTWRTAHGGRSVQATAADVEQIEAQAIGILRTYGEPGAVKPEDLGADDRRMMEGLMRARRTALDALDMYAARQAAPAAETQAGGGRAGAPEGAEGAPPAGVPWVTMDDAGNLVDAEPGTDGAVPVTEIIAEFQAPENPGDGGESAMGRGAPGGIEGTEESLVLDDGRVFHGDETIPAGSYSIGGQTVTTAAPMSARDLVAGMRPETPAARSTRLLAAGAGTEAVEQVVASGSTEGVRAAAPGAGIAVASGQGASGQLAVGSGQAADAGQAEQHRRNYRRLLSEMGRRRGGRGPSPDARALMTYAAGAGLAPRGVYRDLARLGIAPDKAEKMVQARWPDFRRREVSIDERQTLQDIIINDLGGIRDWKRVPGTQGVRLGAEGDYPIPLRLRGKGGSTLDKLLVSLRDYGYDFETVDELYAAIMDETGKQAALSNPQASLRREEEAFDREYREWERDGSEEVEISALRPGSVYTVRGQAWQVTGETDTALEVRPIGPRGPDADAAEFIPYESAALRIDAGSLRAGERETGDGGRETGATDRADGAEMDTVAPAVPDAAAVPAVETSRQDAKSPGKKALEPAKRGKSPDKHGRTLRHFTTPERAERLRTDGVFSFDNAPIHGTGSLDDGPKTGRFAGRRIYLSLDDEGWGATAEFTPSGDARPLDMQNPERDMDAVERGEAESFYDYARQQWMLRPGRRDRKQLEGVDVQIDDAARVLVIESPERLAIASEKYGALLDNDAAWDRLARDYDVVEIRNTQKHAGASKFFRAAMYDQAVVLNAAVAHVAGKQAPPAAKKRALVPPKRQAKAKPPAAAPAATGLTPKQRQLLAISARRAYKAQAAAGKIVEGETFDVWRHAWIREATGRSGLRELTQEDFGPVMDRLNALVAGAAVASGQGAAPAAPAARPASGQSAVGRGQGPAVVNAEAQRRGEAEGETGDGGRAAAPAVPQAGTPVEAAQAKPPELMTPEEWRTANPAVNQEVSEQQHRAAIGDAMIAKRPVSAASVARYGMDALAGQFGYVRQGDMLVDPSSVPAAAPAAAEKKALVPPKRKAKAKPPAAKATPDVAKATPDVASPSPSDTAAVPKAGTDEAVPKAGTPAGAAPDTEINAEAAAEEERFREAQIKKIVEKRESKNREFSAFLRGEGISLDSDILLDSDGTTYVDHAAKDDNGFVQVRLERHTRQGAMQPRLVTVKPGDTITAEMDDSKAGTTRYAEALAAFKERVAKKRALVPPKRQAKPKAKPPAADLLSQAPAVEGLPDLAGNIEAATPEVAKATPDVASPSPASPAGGPAGGLPGLDVAPSRNWRQFAEEAADMMWRQYRDTVRRRDRGARSKSKSDYIREHEALVKLAAKFGISEADADAFVAPHIMATMNGQKAFFDGMRAAGARAAAAEAETSGQGAGSGQAAEDSRQDAAAPSAPSPETAGSEAAAKMSPEQRARLAALTAKLAGFKATGELREDAAPYGGRRLVPPARSAVREDAAKRISGEALQVGLDLAALYAETGLVRYEDFAGAVRRDLPPDMWETLKAHLPAFWNHAGADNPALEEINRKAAAEVHARIEALGRGGPGGVGVGDPVLPGAAPAAVPQAGTPAAVPQTGTPAVVMDAALEGMHALRRSLEAVHGAEAWEERLTPDEQARWGAAVKRAREAVQRLRRGGGARWWDTPAVQAARAAQAAEEQTDGIDTPERMALRAEIAREMYGNGSTIKGRQLWIVMGLPGAGKSRVVVNEIKRRHGAFEVDADVAKTRLPEFAGGAGAGRVHKESAVIAERFVMEQRCLPAGDNVVFPTVGRNAAKLAALVARWQAGGYTVHLVNVEVAPDTSIERAMTRWGESGRFVDPAYIAGLGLQPAQTFATVKSKADSYEHWNNEVPWGTSPILVERGTGVPAGRDGQGAGRGPDAGGRGTGGGGGTAAGQAPDVRGGVAGGAAGLPVGGRDALQNGNPQDAAAAPAGGDGAAGAAGPTDGDGRADGGVPAGIRGRPDAAGLAGDAGDAGGGTLPGAAQRPAAGAAGQPGLLGLDGGVGAGGAQAGPRGGVRGVPVAGDGGGLGAGALHPGVPAGVRGRPQGGAGQGAGVRGADGPAGVHVAGENWRLTRADLAAGGTAARAEANMAALRLLKRIESEGRAATPDEQRILAAYAGWGHTGMKNAIFPVGAPGKGTLGALAAELKQLLTPEEHRTASRSTQYAHYTTPEVIAPMWRAALRLGFRGGRVFEPGYGAGRFLGMIPEEVAGATVMSGIEMDGVSAAIARLLYPRSDLRHGDFVDFPLVSDTFDLVIGNPPFSDRTVTADPHFAKQKLMLHDYFIAKSLAMLKPGGVGILVTSHGTMDKGGQKARALIAREADLLGAIRLPNTAFKTDAGTEVVTDILFIRKRELLAQPGGEAWLELAEIRTADGGKAWVNEYFARHPEMVLGRHALSGKMRFGGGREYTVEPAAGDLEAQVAAAVARLPEIQPAAPAPSAAAAPLPAAAPSGADAKAAALAETRVDGGFLADGARVFMAEGAVRVPVLPIAERKHAAEGDDNAYYVSKDALGVIRSYIPLRNAYIAVMREQRQAGNDAQLAAAQRELKKQYERFLFRHGRLGRSVARTVTDKATGEETESRRYPNIDAIKMDVWYGGVAGLERYDADGAFENLAPLFSERVIGVEPEARVETPADALAAALRETGRADIARAAALLGRGENETAESLGDLVYRDPSDGRWLTAQQYLTGNVKEKLKAARSRAAADASYRRNVEALEKVQPADLPPSRISLELGMPVIPPVDIRRFMDEVVGVRVDAVAYQPLTGRWTVTPGSAGNRSRRVVPRFATRRRTADEILESVLANQPVEVYDTDKDGKRVYNAYESAAANEAARQMRDAWGAWVWVDPERMDRLARAFNEAYNVWHDEPFDGSHLTFPGLSTEIKPYPHQRDVAWRFLSSGNTYAVHEVGLGKTIGAILGVMESRRIGAARKPMIVVPNHMLGQWNSDFMATYPAARILLADEDHFAPRLRQRFLGHVAAGNYDAVIITHSAFKLLGVAPETEKKFIDDELAEYRRVLTQMDKQDRGRKDIEKAIERLEDKLKRLSQLKRDKGLVWDDLGVDMLVVDEAHEYRKLAFQTTRTRTKGIDPEGSDKAWDLNLKLQLLHRRSPGRNVMFLSGTPIVNTMAEAFSVLRMLAPDALNQAGVATFDAWASTFAGDVQSFEKTAGVGYQIVSRLGRWQNLQMLAGIWRQVADYKRYDDLPYMRARVSGRRPVMRTGGIQGVVVPESPAQKDYRERVVTERIEAIKQRSGPPHPGDDILLSVITDAIHVALDERFADPSLPPDPDGKLARMAAKIVEIWEEGNRGPVPDRRTQIVFMDKGLPDMETRRGFSTYLGLRRALIDAGIPAREIAFAQDFKKKADKERLQADVRAGRVRVLIGSMQGMGTGMNVQERLAAAHFMTIPWYPALVEQAAGRIIRQGNMFARSEVPAAAAAWAEQSFYPGLLDQAYEAAIGEVDVFAYMTAGTIEEFMWGMNETKSRWIEGFYRGGTDSMDGELDSQSDQYALLKQMTSDDPRVRQLAEMQSELARLQSLERAHLDGMAMAARNLKRAEDTERDAAESAARLEALPTAPSTRADAFRVQIGAVSYDKRKDAAGALGAAVMGVIASRGDGVKVASFGAGYDVFASGWEDKTALVKLVHGQTVLVSAIKLGGDDGHTPGGVLQQLENTLASVPALTALYKSRVKDAHEDAARLRGLIKPWDRSDEMNQMRADIQRIKAEMAQSSQAAAHHGAAPAPNAPNAPGGVREAAAGYGQAPANPWPDNFGKVMLMSSGPRVRNHADHAAAKAGDAEAAVRLVADLGKPAKLRAFAAEHPGAIVVSVHGEEASGRNALPRAYARYIGEVTGLDVDTGIVMANRVGHTGAGHWHRLAVRSEFDGEVLAGREYLLVDDLVRDGGTLSELRRYIEARGGRVVGVSTLGHAIFADTIALSDKTRVALEKRYGLQSLRDFLKEHGLYGGEHRALTEGEGRTLLSAGSLDEARNRIAEARRQAGLGSGRGVAAQEPARPGEEGLGDGQEQTLQDAGTARADQADGLRALPAEGPAGGQGPGGAADAPGGLPGESGAGPLHAEAAPGSSLAAWRLSDNRGVAPRGPGLPAELRRRAEAAVRANYPDASPEAAAAVRETLAQMELAFAAPADPYPEPAPAPRRMIPDALRLRRARRARETALREQERAWEARKFQIRRALWAWSPQHLAELLGDQPDAGVSFVGPHGSRERMHRVKGGGEDALWDGGSVLVLDGASEVVIRSPLDVARLMLPLRSPEFESFRVVALDKDNRVLGARVMSTGLVDSCPASARVALGWLPPGTAGIIVAHNHPSGDPTPSGDDVRISTELARLGEIIGIPVLDHIITNGSYTSQRGMGLAKFGGPDPYGGDYPQGALDHLAVWEVAPHTMRAQFHNPEDVAPYARPLREAALAHGGQIAHVLMVDTKNRLVAVERIDAAALSPEQFAARALGAVLHHGAANGVFLDFSFADKRVARLERAAASAVSAAGLRMLDSFDSAYRSKVRMEAKGGGWGGLALDAAPAAEGSVAEEGADYGGGHGYGPTPPERLTDAQLGDYAAIEYLRPASARAFGRSASLVPTFQPGLRRVALTEEQARAVSRAGEMFDALARRSRRFADELIPSYDTTPPGPLRPGETRRRTFRPSTEPMYNVKFLEFLDRVDPVLSETLAARAFEDPLPQRPGSLAMARASLDPDDVASTLAGRAAVYAGADRAGVSHTRSGDGAPDLAEEPAPYGGRRLVPPPRSEVREFAGTLARTAPDTSRAETMEKAGSDREAVWRETGFWRGPDGEWRFELDTSRRMLKPAGLALAEKSPQPLASVIDHPALFAAYPRMRRIYVERRTAPGRREASLQGKRIVLTGPAGADFDSVLAHEVQHAIQDWEVWDKGGNMSAESLIEPLVEERRRLNRELAEMAKSGLYDSAEYRAKAARRDAIIDEEWQIENPDNARGAYDAYRRLAGEAEARLAERRLNMTPEERAAEPPWETLEKMLRGEGLLKDGQRPEDVLLRPGASVGEDRAEYSAARSAVTPEQDAAYLAAVEAGDMDTAQRMVDAALATKSAYWHGTPSGDLRGGVTGLHVGTKQAATEALEARIGIPADGRPWDGTRKYGETLLAGRQRVASGQFGRYRNSGYNAASPNDDFYAKDHKFPTVGDGIPVDPEWKPWLRPVLIVGEMSNNALSPMSDARANGTMRGALKKGSARRGYFYRNEGEDAGSISAVLPNGDAVRVKLADAVTRDESGRVIPLSERFDPERDDILHEAPAAYSVRESGVPYGSGSVPPAADGAPDWNAWAELAQKVADFDRLSGRRIEITRAIERDRMTRLAREMQRLKRSDAKAKAEKTAGKAAGLDAARRTYETIAGRQADEQATVGDLMREALAIGRRRGRESRTALDLTRMLREALNARVKRLMGSQLPLPTDWRARNAAVNRRMLGELGQIETSIQQAPAPQRAAAAAAELRRLFGLDRVQWTALEQEAGLGAIGAPALLEAARKAIERDLRAYYRTEFTTLFGGRPVERRLPSGQTITVASEGLARRGLRRMVPEQRRAMEDLLAGIDFANIKDMPLDAMRQTAERAREILADDALAKEAIAEGHQIRRENAAEAAAAEIVAARPELEQVETADPRKGGLLQRLGWFTASQRRRALLLSGGDEAGAVGTVLWRNLLAASERQLTLETADLRALDDKLAGLGFTRASLLALSYQPREVELADGRTVLMTRGEMMTLYGMTLDEDARAKLVRNGWRPARWRHDAGRTIRGEGEDYDARLAASEAIVGGVVARLTPAEKALTEWMVVDQSREWARRGNETSRRISGAELFEDRPHITLAGSIDRQAELPNVEDPAFSFRAHMVDRMGLTRERQAHTHPLLVRDMLSVYRQQARDMSVFTAWSLPFRDAISMLSRGPALGAIVSRWGVEAVRTMKETLAYAVYQKGHTDTFNALQKWFYHRERAAAGFILGLRASSAALNRYGGAITMAAGLAAEGRGRSGDAARFLARVFRPQAGLARLGVRERKAAYDAMMADGYLYDRWHRSPYRVFAQMASQRLEAEEADRASQNARSLGRQDAWRRFQQWALSGMTKGEIGNGVDMYLTLRSGGMSQADAVREVSRLTRLTQNPSTPLEETTQYSAIRSAGLGFVLPFQGQPSVLWDWVKSEHLKSRRSGEWRGFRAALNGALSATLFSVALRLLVRRAAKGLMDGDDDDDKALQAEAANTILDLAGELSGAVMPGGDQVAQGLLRPVLSAAMDNRSLMAVPPGDSTLLGQIGESAQRLGSAGLRLARGDDWSEEQVEKVFIDAHRLLGMTLGLPTGGIEQAARVGLGLAGDPLGREPPAAPAPVSRRRRLLPPARRR